MGNELSASLGLITEFASFVVDSMLAILSLILPLLHGSSENAFLSGIIVTSSADR